MTYNNKIFVWIASISLVLFIVSLITFTQLLTLLEPNIEGIEFVIKGRLTAFLFSASLALIPVLTVASWRISRITSLSAKMLSILIIVTIIAAALFIRHQMVKIFFNSVVRPLLLTNGKNTHCISNRPKKFCILSLWRAAGWLVCMLFVSPT